MTQAPSLDNWIQQFKTFESGLNGQAQGPIHDLRRNALTQFERVGFPTTEDETWKNVNVTPVTRGEFQAAPIYKTGSVPSSDLGPYILPDTFQLVFINGQFAKDLSDLNNIPKGVRIASLSEALKTDAELVHQHLGHHVTADHMAFTALNTAFVKDGAFIHLSRNTQLEKPIHVLFVSTTDSTPMVTHPRSLIIAEANSQVSLIETYAGLNGTYFTNAVTEIVADDNAHVDHYKRQQESLDSVHVANLQTVVGRSANITSHAISLGGAFVRNDVSARLQGEGCEATLNGLYVLEGTQHLDNYTLLEHAEPHCPSHELYKGILGGSSRSVFRGKIHVHQKAQKTDAYQQNQNILVSNNARVNTKPQLEIYADDVKCSHGATIGQLNEDALFYLQARGIPKNQAHRVLLGAFAKDILDRVKITSLRTQLETLIDQKLDRIYQNEIAV